MKTNAKRSRALMPGAKTELMQEIDVNFREMQQDSQPIVAAWLAQRIVKKHEPTIQGEGCSWFLSRAYSDVRTAVNQFIRHVGSGSTKDDRQMMLPGHTHLQCWYSVEREGEPVAVRIEQLSNKELRMKARQIHRAGSTQIAHAAEILRYVDKREQQQVRLPLGKIKRRKRSEAGKPRSKR